MEADFGRWVRDEHFRPNNKRSNSSVICFRSISISDTILYIVIYREKAVSSFVRVQVVALHDVGFNQVQISKQLNSFLCRIQNAVNNYEHLGTCEDSKRSARPKKLDGQDFWHFKRLVKGDAHVSATKIAWDLNASLPKPVTTRTVCTYWKELGFEYVVKMKK